jgi:hypothetical protein
VAQPRTSARSAKVPARILSPCRVASGAADAFAQAFDERLGGRVYWSFDGTERSIARQQFIDMPANSSGRMSFYLRCARR